MRVLLPEQRTRELLRSPTGFVAVANAVRDTLVDEFEVPFDKITVVNGFVPIVDLAAAERTKRRLRILHELHWPEDAFVVGACGSLGWRKGTDLFLQIARATSVIGPQQLRFLWVGGPTRDNGALEFDYDVRALGLGGRCQRIPATSDVLDYYCAMNVFALTSREDPFPLVMLEAASHGVPTVCFEGSGGAQDFVEQGAGAIAPYLDVAAFAEHLIRLRKAPALCARTWSRCFNKSAHAIRRRNSCAEIAEHHRPLHFHASVIEHSIPVLRRRSFTN